MKKTLCGALALLLLTTILSESSNARAQGTTAFTYQGQLHDGGTNANGAYTMIFKLYDALSAGSLVSAPITNSPMLANGLFTVNLDFGANAFNGSARWLDITVQAGTNAAETLAPRVQVQAAPYAQFATIAGAVANGGITSAQIASGAVVNSSLAANAVNAANIASSQVVKSLNGLKDAVVLAAGTNVTLTTNGQTLTFSSVGGGSGGSASNVVVGTESNLRVVRGVLLGNGSILTGSGFTATYVLPGTGGTNIGNFNIGQVGGDYQLTATGNFTSQVNQWDWLLVGGQIMQVQSVSFLNPTTTIRLYGTGCGGLSGSVSVSIKPRLAIEWNITFTPPFSGFTTIAVSSHTDDAFSQDNLTTVHLRRQLSDNGTNFQAVIRADLPMGGGYPGGCPPYDGRSFEFIAVGPR